MPANRTLPLAAYSPGFAKNQTQCSTFGDEASRMNGMLFYPSTAAVLLPASVNSNRQLRLSCGFGTPNRIASDSRRLTIPLTVLGCSFLSDQSNLQMLSPVTPFIEHPSTRMKSSTPSELTLASSLRLTILGIFSNLLHQLKSRNVVLVTSHFFRRRQSYGHCHHSCPE